MTDAKAQDAREGVPVVERLRTLQAFLEGVGELDGLWFGESKQRKSGLKVPYWWRSSHLPVVDEAADLISELLEALHNLMVELEWVNEQLDLMPDDYAEAQTRAAAILAKARGQ